MFFGYINSPMVGRNLLGDDGFSQLKERIGPDAQIMAVMSRGLYPHLSDDFIPGSSPDRLGLQQNNLAVEIRDINVFDQTIRLSADGMPVMEMATLFRVGGNAGFNPGAGATLKMGVTLSRNHLVADSTELDIPVAFADELFETVEVAPRPEDNRQPVWIGLWKERWLTISILGTSLTILTVFFARQRTLSRHPKLVHHFRWGFLFFTLFYIGFYIQGQLSVVNIYTLFLAIWDGFSLNVFLMDPALFILWTYTFITLFIWGRGLFCGWLCPLGAGLAVLGKLRLFNWLDRVELCGKPCQHCKHSCGINAIRKEGRIDYNECIQCLECVVILKDENQCVDKLLEKKRQRQANILATDAG